jgi:Na+-translocating ferredoxin:NAD+ oxidoreductase RnfE subunit
MRISYRASIVEIVTLLFEQFSPLSLIKFVSIFLSVVNAGCLGVGRAAYSLPIIETTSSMVGRSLGLSWTQRRPMLMNLNGIELEEGYPFVGSINSKPRSSIHNSQA